MIDYTRWTKSELEREKARIEEELLRRPFGFRVIVDPTMPPDTMEIYSGPHRVRITGLG